MLHPSRESAKNLTRQASTFAVPPWKRALDIACILVFAPLLLPLSFLIAAVIKLVSPGPAIFKQERIGFLGKRFTCLKFRTMMVNAGISSHQGHLSHLMTANCPMTKLDCAGDPRLIRFGRLLRSLGLDELPQILNVLHGEMSLVGPRPCLGYEYEKYLPRHRRRCETLPGLTGYWQVNGKNDTTFERMVELDIYYIEHKSVLLDLQIMVRTIPTLLGQAGKLIRMKKANSKSLQIEGAEGSPAVHAIKSTSGR